MKPLARMPPVRRPEPGAATGARPPAPALQKLITDAVVYEDADLMVVNKPAGIAVHGGSGLSHGVIEVLRAACPDCKELDLVHRLDRETSGCLIVAKRRAALRRVDRTDLIQAYSWVYDFFVFRSLWYKKIRM
jgi:23S rRNA pseudouridine955/2504/2580 synthase